MSMKILNSPIFLNKSTDKEVHTGPREWIYYDAEEHGLPTTSSLKFKYVGRYYTAKDNFTSRNVIYYTTNFDDTWSSASIPSSTLSDIIQYQGKYYMFRQNYMYSSTDMSTWTQESNSTAYAWQQLFVTGDGRLIGATLSRVGVTEPGGTTFTSFLVSDYGMSNIGCIFMDNTGSNIWIYSNATDKKYIQSSNCGASFYQSPDYMEYGTISGCVDGTNSRWVYGANGNLMGYHNFYVTSQPAVYPTIRGGSYGNVAYGNGVVCAINEVTQTSSIASGDNIQLDVYLNYGLNDKKLRYHSVTLTNESDRTSSGSGGRLFYAKDRFLYCRYNGLIYYSLPVGSGMYSTSDGIVIDGSTGETYDIKPKGKRFTILFGEEELRKSYPYDSDGNQWQIMINGIYSDGSFDQNGNYIVANVVDTNGVWYYVTDDSGNHVTLLDYISSDIEYKCIDVVGGW